MCQNTEGTNFRILLKYITLYDKLICWHNYVIPQVNQLLVLLLERVKPGFHYPSSWPEFTGRVDDGPWTLHFLIPELTARVDRCQKMHPSWRPVNSGAFFTSVIYWLLVTAEWPKFTATMQAAVMVGKVQTTHTQLTQLMLLLSVAHSSLLSVAGISYSSFSRLGSHSTKADENSRL